MALTAEYDSVLCLRFFSLKIIVTTLFIFILFFVPITNFPYGTRFLGVISTKTLMIFNQFQFIFPSDQPLHLHWNSLFPVSAALSSSRGSFVVIFENVFVFLLDLPLAHESE